MDKKVIEEHLKLVTHHVIEGEKHIASQRELLAQLELEGRDTTMALRLLDNFAELQVMHVADMERLTRELAEY